MIPGLTRRVAQLEKQISPKGREIGLAELLTAYSQRVRDKIVKILDALIRTVGDDSYKMLVALCTTWAIWHRLKNHKIKLPTTESIKLLRDVIGLLHLRHLREFEVSVKLGKPIS